MLPQHVADWMKARAEAEGLANAAWLRRLVMTTMGSTMVKCWVPQQNTLQTSPTTHDFMAARVGAQADGSTEFRMFSKDGLKPWQAGHPADPSLVDHVRENGVYLEGWPEPWQLSASIVDSAADSQYVLFLKPAHKRGANDMRVDLGPATSPSVEYLLRTLGENPARDGSLARDLDVPQAVVQAVLEGLKMSAVLIDAPKSEDGYVWKLIGTVDQALEIVRKLGVLDMSLHKAAESERLSNLDHRRWLLQNPPGMSRAADHMAHRLAYEYARSNFASGWAFVMNHTPASGELAARGLIEEVRSSGGHPAWRFTEKGKRWAVDDTKR